MDHDRNDQWRRLEDGGPPESVAIDELGYQSAGALSVGSHGSGEHHHAASYFRQLPHLMNGETRFPSAFYAASEAAKSDIATVCSGSVIEDIEVASVMSAEYNNAAQIPNNLLPSPPSSERSAFSGSNRRTFSGGRVEFATLPISVPTNAASLARQQSVLSQDSNNNMSVVYDMGPPLSRALLLQHPSTQGFFGSQAGSVRSFGSTAGAASDVGAHVDTDDCGGSITDGHSIHSQEGDNTAARLKDGDDDDKAQPNDNSDPLREARAEANPLRNDDSSSVPSNGRVSPGGTVYRGRGVRRYQGRYMNLPLKRFHQNGVELLCHDSSAFPQQNGFHNDDDYNMHTYDHHEYDSRMGRNNGDDRKRSPSPPSRYTRRTRSRSRSPPQNYTRKRSPPRHERWGDSRSWRNRSKSPKKNRYKSYRDGGRSSGIDRNNRNDSPKSRHWPRNRNGARSRSRS